MTLSELETHGFDRSHAEANHLYVGCSQCEPLVIQGIPTHETGCPNQMRECAGCWNLIPARSWAKYCEDCQ